VSAAALRVALLGNPNCGKTALFNLLTGSRQKVANYAGATVERKSGRCRLADGRSLELLDLPGAYSLDAASPEEAITRDVCRGEHPAEPRPDLLVCVVDATNLRLHLRFVLELRRLGLPMVVALNMMDAAERRGIAIDRAALARALGVPVVPTVAVRRGGAAELLDCLAAGGALASDRGRDDHDLHAEVRALLRHTVSTPATADARDDAIDRVVLHPLAGPLLLAAVMFLVFQAVFAWAAPLQDGLAAATAWAGGALAEQLPAGHFRGLLVEGVLAGAGTVLVFMPQIVLLFAFLLVLEQSGYLPRAAFLLDRPMHLAGLSGRSFIPLLSSFACAVPGILATRSIQDPRERLATILVAPLMTCSARLPVYTLLIGAFIPRQPVAAVLNLQGIVLFALYAAGIASALLLSSLLRRLRGRGIEQMLMMELPAYRLPHPRDIALGLWERVQVFLRRVATIILALTVLLWSMASFPAPPPGADRPAIEYSLAGRAGAALAHVFAPIGFNWQISIALVPGLAAREVVVSALATVYAVSADGDDDAAAALSPLIATRWPLATAISLLVWFVYAPQCVSTLAVVRRETGSWRYAAAMAAALFGIAYLAAWVAFHLTRWAS
jgi:ferrous iron transport protein B